MSAGESAFTNQLIVDLSRAMPDLDLSIIITIGATELRDSFSGKDLAMVLDAYMHGLRIAWVIGIASAGLAFIISLFILVGKNETVQGHEELHIEEHQESRSIDPK